MKFYSTRDKNKENLFTLKDAAFLGLAQDGGLFMPISVPQINLGELEKQASVSFPHMAYYVSSLLLESENPPIELFEDAFNFPIPLIETEPGYETLELFHGPTFAFKDFGARFMGRMMGYLGANTEPITILTATSGDTGSAVAQGFYNVDGVKVVVLYPEGKVSDFQEAQMTTLGNNIYPIRVKGTFDDCQILVKMMFSDRDLRSKRRISSANSINILRWLPQSFYYFYGWCLWTQKHNTRHSPVICVPSGNYGNITAGMLASKMGLPVKYFICGSNSNDVVPEYLANGQYIPRPSVQTVANAMDVGAPSNFERLQVLYGSDYNSIISNLNGFSYSDEQIKNAIKSLYVKSGYISDPHSAVGYLAYKDGAKPYEGFWMSTAHQAKFQKVVKDSIGLSPKLPLEFESIIKKERNYFTMENDSKALKSYVLNL